MKETENSGSGIFFDFLKVMAAEKGRRKERKERGRYMLAEQGKCEGKIKLGKRKGNQGADIGENLFDIQTVILSLLGLFVFGYLVFIAVSVDRKTVKERVGVEFIIDDVYATTNNYGNLFRYVSLIAPNGREVTIQDKGLYKKLRNHIGQKVTLEVDRSYVL